MHHSQPRQRPQDQGIARDLADLASEVGVDVGVDVAMEAAGGVMDLAGDLLGAAFSLFDVF
ncbi:MAG TPA: hypothetical protein VFO85_08130 [Vicinamibacteria bacterium]|nr:hypothetical protein [Vicinamibacteria bacterium]